jgi:mRNA turnover protein 4
LISGPFFFKHLKQVFFPFSNHFQIFFLSQAIFKSRISIVASSNQQSACQKQKRIKKSPLLKSTKRSLRSQRVSSKNNNTIPDALITKIHDSLAAYPNVYIVSVQNMRNKHQKLLRLSLAQSSLFLFGRNRIMAIALGTSAESEPVTGTHVLAPHLAGQVGIVFSSLTRAELTHALDGAKTQDYARAGANATKTVVVPAGPVVDSNGIAFPHSMEPQLRKLGLPCRLDVGVVTLTAPWVLCREGVKLTFDQAHLLRHMKVCNAKFNDKGFDGRV